MEKKVIKQNLLSKMFNENKVLFIAIPGFIVFLCLIIFMIIFFIPQILHSETKLSEESIKLFQQGKIKYLEKNLNESINLLNQLIKKNKRFTNGYFMLGKAYFFNNQPKLAKDTWEKALGINPDHINTLIWLGIYYNSDSSTINKSIELFNKVLDLDSLNILANYNLAKIYFNKKDYKKSILYFNNALENELNLSDIHIDMAKMYMELELKDRAINEINKAKNLILSGSQQKELNDLETKFIMDVADEKK